jgi:hypothetical protein
VVEREHRLDTGCRELVRHQPAGGVRADPSDHSGARPEAGGGEGSVDGRPAGTKLDATVNATAEYRSRKRPVEHHVADGDQIREHPRRLIS